MTSLSRSFLLFPSPTSAHHEKKRGKRGQKNLLIPNIQVIK
jgi:hypothetical protein